MPKLSEFLGIKITMYADEHGVPHFHARYEGRTVAIGIKPLTVLAGGISPRQLGNVIEWAARHPAELEAAWKTLQSGGEPQKIAPLD